MAVLIDGDSIAPEWVEVIWALATSWGPVTFCRAWRTQPSKAWDRLASATHIAPFTLKIVGENPDIVMAMEAEAVLHTTTIRRFCLVTRDKDFALVAKRLAASGTVIGMGTPPVSEELIEACDDFIVLTAALKTRHLRLPRVSARQRHTG